MRFFLNLSIKNKLIGIVLLVTLLAIGVGFTLVITNDIKIFKEDMVDNTVLNARLIGDYCVVPLTFHDKAGAKEVLEKLEGVPYIMNALVYDNDGNLFATFNKFGETNIVLLSGEGASSVFDNNYLHVVQPIIYHSQKYGTIYLRASTNLLADKINNYLITMVSLIIGLMFLSYFLASKLQKVISKPILTLAGVTKEISSKGDYSVRVEKKGTDEIGVLYDGFNDMLEQINIREMERERAEEALRESEEKFRVLYESSKDAIMILDKERFFNCNESTLKLFKCKSVKEFTSKHPADLSPPKQPDGTPSMETSMQHINKAYRTGTDHFSCVHKKMDGTIFPADVLLTKMKLGEKAVLQATVRDITERKRAEEALIEQHNLLSALINTLPEVIYVKDKDHRFIAVNREFARLYGAEKPDEFIGKTDFDLYPHELAEQFQAAEQLIMRSGQPQINKVDLVVDKTGNKKWLTNSKLPFLDSEGKIRGLVGFSFDITESKQAEEELRKHREHLEELVKERTSELERKSRGLEQANIKLQGLDRLKSMFIASMSHELRTPLNSIIGFTGIILQGMTGEVTEEQQKQLTMVKNSAKHLLALINDVIDVSKIEAGKVELAIEEFDLSGLIQEVRDSFKAGAEEKGLKLSLEMPERLVIKSDERRTKQVLVNLMGNAVKFTDRGKIEIKLTKKDRMAEISVKDTGIGIKREYMNELFKAFSQIPVEDRPKQEGTGLGLYLSKKIASLLGGEINVESEVGKGSVFTFSLPIVYTGEDKRKNR